LRNVKVRGQNLRKGPIELRPSSLAIRRERKRIRRISVQLEEKTETEKQALGKPKSGIRSVVRDEEKKKKEKTSLHLVRLAKRPKGRNPN